MYYHRCRPHGSDVAKRREGRVLSATRLSHQVVHQPQQRSSPCQTEIHPVIFVSLVESWKASGAGRPTLKIATHTVSRIKEGDERNRKNGDGDGDGDGDALVALTSQR